jgi:2-isopropylmalate synthase
VSSDKIIVFDTTLRDGEQAAGTRLGPREKVEIAQQLARLGVDVIEAGFPISSPRDFESVQLIAKEVQGATICGLTRAVTKDIEVAGEALAPAKRRRIHTGLGISDIHIASKFRDDKYGKTLEEKKARAMEMGVAAVKCAKKFTDDIEFYCEDSGRADKAYLLKLVEAVIDAGATTVNIPDTTGYSIPEQFGALIAELIAKVPNSRKAIFSVHCHDDLGMSVANSLAGVKCGARQIEGTINGIGERAGNASLEEIVMAIRTRKDYFGIDTSINAKEFFRTSRMVAEMLGMPVPANKAIVGANAFAHSSGIHVDGFIKNPLTYEIIRPQEVGAPESEVILTARTGRAGLKHRLQELGYSLSKDELEQVYTKFLDIADKKKQVYDEDLAALIGAEMRSGANTFEMQYLHVACGTGTIPTASVRMKVAGADEPVLAAACGDGPIDAAYEAIKIATGKSPKLENFALKAITGGKEAMGEATVKILDEKNRRFTGRGVSTDIIEASAKAYVDAINRMMAGANGHGEAEAEL